MALSHIWMKPKHQAILAGRRCIVPSFCRFFFDPHINRSPAAGRVEFLQYRPGAFYDARSKNSLTKNENQDVGIRTSEPGFPVKVLIRQSSGAIARRIVCRANKDMVLRRGQKYGMIKFGSRTTLFLPADSRVEWRVKIGDRVKAGETVLCSVLPANDS